MSETKLSKISLTDSSQTNLVTWKEINESHDEDSEDLVEELVDKVLKNFDEIVGGEFNQKSACSLLKNRSPVEKPSAEDRRLVNWKRWLDIRAEDSKIIQKVTHRSRAELLVNANPNEVREILKNKKFLDKTSNDPVDIKFWKVAPTSRQGLHATFPKSDRELVPPEIIYTQTPDLVLKEQNVGKTKTPSRASRMLIEKLQQEQAGLFEPSMDQLVLKGNDKNPTIIEVKTPRRKDDSLFLNRNYDRFRTEERKQILTINGIAIDSTFPDKNIHVDLVFEAFKFQSKTKILKLNNTGEIAINLTFQDPPIDESLPFVPNSKFFNYNNSTFRIIPGEALDVPFQFHPTQIGISNVKLTLACDPEFSRECQICINLLGLCEKKYKIEDDLRKIEDGLVRNAAEHDVNRVIKEITRNCADHFKVVQRNLFKDADKEAFNRVNPKLFYDPDCVQMMTEMFCKLCGGRWDFNIEALYQRILEIKDVEQQKLAYDELMQNIDHMKDSQRTVVIDDEELTKFSLVRNIFAAFFDNFEAKSDLEASIKNDFTSAINKMICVLES